MNLWQQSRSRREYLAFQSDSIASHPVFLLALIKLNSKVMSPFMDGGNRPCRGFAVL